MMIKKLAAMFTTLIMCLSILSATAFAADNNDNNYIEVTGYGFGPKNANVRSSFYKTYARQAARLDALRRILEAMQDVHLPSETTVVDMMLSSNDAIVTRLSGVVVNAKQVGKAKFNEDGSCAVTMRFYPNK
ncbi:MAG: hypothetical protein IJ563_11615 [Selenomonadaceae bacterium]|nr:hypothetical protein [Selenomonadaceae bacterium]MBR1859408.1 hypothetical protein [Selenomonadaceae bacterium]